MNRLEKLIPNTRINFKAANLGDFDYKMLMKNKNILLHDEIINTYTKLDLKKRFMEISTLDEDTTGDHLYIYKDIRKQILEVNDDLIFVVDVLIEFLYNHKKSNHKTTLWSSFGDVIVGNLRANMDFNKIQCQNCGERILNYSSKKYCEECAKKIKYKKVAELKRIKRKSGIKLKNAVILDT